MTTNDNASPASASSVAFNAVLAEISVTLDRRAQRLRHEGDDDDKLRAGELCQDAIDLVTQSTFDLDGGRDSLIEAAALLVAEVQRLDRAALRGGA